jgi:hypothetical protein
VQLAAFAIAAALVAVVLFRFATPRSKRATA